MGLLLRGQAGDRRHHQPDRREDQLAGDVRDGGSYEERFSKVGVWNNLMDEAEFLFAKWNEFNAA